MTPNPQDIAVALEVERAAFEAWALSERWICSINSFGEYTYETVRDGWEAWQARASQSDGTSWVPDGWKLVPVEPTPEMLDALHDAIGHDVQTGTSWDGDEEVSVLDVHTFPDAYRAMLAAAPNQGENHVG